MDHLATRILKLFCWVLIITTTIMGIFTSLLIDDDFGILLAICYFIGGVLSACFYLLFSKFLKIYGNNHKDSKL